MGLGLLSYHDIKVHGPVALRETDMTRILCRYRWAHEEYKLLLMMYIVPVFDHQGFRWSAVRDGRRVYPHGVDDVL